MADTDIVENLIPSRTCIVGFASMGEDCGGGIPTFEWARSFAHLGVATVLMRDRHLVWYQRGVEGVGGIMDVFVYMRGLAEKYPRVITTGISMGGYAALLFGLLAGVPEIVALSPQTRLHDDERWDKHWQQHVHPIMVYGDLAPLLNLHPNRPKITAFIGDQPPDYLKDLEHAQRVQPDRLITVPGCTHSSVGPYIRDDGFFTKLVTDAAA